MNSVPVSFLDAGFFRFDSAAFLIIFANNSAISSPTLLIVMFGEYSVNRLHRAI